MRILLLLSVMLFNQSYAQDLVFSSEVSTDHIGIDEVFELTISIENGDGNFSAPILDNFDIVGGPNVQSSIQIINGDMSKQKSYTYYLKAKSIGELVIESAELETSEGILTTDEIFIIVNNNGESDGSNQRSEIIQKKKVKVKQKRKSIFDKRSSKRI